MSFSLSCLVRPAPLLGQVVGQELAEAFGALVVENLLGRAFLLDAAFVQEHRVVGDLAREADLVATYRCSAP